MWYRMVMKGTKKQKPERKKSAEEGHYHLRLPDELNDWTREYTRAAGFQSEVEVMRHALRELRARVVGQVVPEITASGGGRQAEAL